jgi:hypothetical protein
LPGPSPLDDASVADHLGPTGLDDVEALAALGLSNMRVSVLQRTTYLIAVTGYPASSAAGEEVVTAGLKADAERRP